MTTKFVLDFETMNELEAFSAKYEQLRNFADFVYSFAWENIVGIYDGEEPDKLGCFLEMLSTAAHVRDDELEAVIKKIAPLPEPAKE